MNLNATTADIDDWEKDENKFEKLVALGADERTPEHERNVACREACRMVAEGKISGWAKDRARMLKRQLARIQELSARISRR